MFQDWKWPDFPLDQLNTQLTFMTMDETDCCTVLNIENGKKLIIEITQEYTLQYVQVKAVAVLMLKIQVARF